MKETISQSTEGIKEEWKNIYNAGDYFYLGADKYTSEEEGRSAGTDQKHYVFTVLTYRYREITI